MIRVPSADGGAPPLPNVDEREIEASMLAQLADDVRLLNLIDRTEAQP